MFNSTLKTIIHQTQVKCVIFITFCLLNSCHPQSKVKQLEWLIGTWENQTQKGSIYERWTKVNAQKLMAESFKIENGDTLVLETVSLIQEADSLFFIPTVENQNEGKVIRFSLKEMTDSKMVFTNPEHDFPQVISYTQINQDSLVAEISGKQDSGQNKRLFPMKRVR